MNWFKRTFGSKKQEAPKYTPGVYGQTDLFSRFLNDDGKCGCGGQYRASRGQRPKSPRYQLRLQSFFTFNGRVCFCADDQKTSAQEQWRELLMEQTESASGVLFSFRMNEETSNNTGINGCALSWLTGGGLCKAGRSLWQGILPLKLSFPLSVTSFWGMNKNAEYDQAYPQYAQEYSKGEWELFKKITRQTYGKNGFSKIGNNFCEEFPSRVVDDRFHHLNNSIEEQGRQEKLPREASHELV